MYQRGYIQLLQYAPELHCKELYKMLATLCYSYYKLCSRSQPTLLLRPPLSHLWSFYRVCDTWAPKKDAEAFSRVKYHSIEAAPKVDRHQELPDISERATRAHHFRHSGGSKRSHDYYCTPIGTYYCNYVCVFFFAGRSKRESVSWLNPINILVAGGMLSVMLR